MVDVSGKANTHRTARAQTIVRLPETAMAALSDGELHTKKGPVFQTAILAGTMAAKQTATLIPLCHVIPLDKCAVHIATEGADRVVIECTVSAQHRTGVEMEALTGASVAALTVYDMCKAFSHDIVIEQTRLLEKRGGKSDYDGG